MEYEIKKKNIKNFIIRVYPNGSIKISVPIKASDRDIENFIQNKKEWLENTFKKIENKNSFKNENLTKILGEIKEKKYIESELDMVRISLKKIYIYYDKRKNIEKEKIFEDWKLELLKNLLEEYLNKYLKILNTKIIGYKIKKMSSAWGIYYPKNNSITFNSLLIEKEKICIEYVVLHELCHIFYQNHKKEFWNLVEKNMENYKIIRNKLKE